MRAIQLYDPQSAVRIPHSCELWLVHPVRSPQSALDAYRTLYRLHGLATTEGHRDGTVYGTARTATRSFHAHHLRLISLAINVATAELISAGASVLAGRLFSPDAA